MMYTPKKVFNLTKFASLGLLVALGGSTLGGCTSVRLDPWLQGSQSDSAGFTEGKLVLARSEDQRKVLHAEADTLLRQSLGQREAVLLAIVNSPALQALIARNWANATGAAQGGRIRNPVLVFERLRLSDELEIGRLLAFGLLDLFTLPQRQAMAQQDILRTQLELALEAVEYVTDTRQAWVRAVAAQQALSYARQVNDIAEASAELARRMQQVGNFSRLQRARQQAFYADAATQLALASHAATATREGLARILGLSADQASRLNIPERLPEIPAAPRTPSEVSSLGSRERLDIALARRALEATAIARGINLVTSFTDIELGIRRDSVGDTARATNDTRRGYEVTLSLPVFDWGDMQRANMDAQVLAAMNHLEATIRAAGPNLRESYSAYRTSHDIARHYRDEIVPLRKVIAEENQLRYNGMLIGVFELLADARDQVGSVIAAINAQRQFWLADAALQATLMGKPTLQPLGAAVPGMSSANVPH